MNSSPTKDRYSGFSQNHLRVACGLILLLALFHQASGTPIQVPRQSTVLSRSPSAAICHERLTDRLPETVLDSAVPLHLTEEHARRTLDEFCTQSRYGGPAEYLDSLTTAVIQWYDEGPDLEFPYRPLQFEIDLYFSDTGSADDSVRLLIALSCPSFGEVCCTPRVTDCIGQVWVSRGSPFPVLKHCAIDLTGFDCCLLEGFWAIVFIERLTGSMDPPSFVFSSQANDPNPIPDCEQWLYTNMAWSRDPVGDMGWASLRLSGECTTCDTAQPVECDTSTTGMTLDCEQILNVTCGVESIVLTNQSTSGEPSDVSQYCCASWDESGPEKVYSIDVPHNGNLAVEIFNVQGGDLDLFVLESCEAQTCIAAADSAVQLLDLTNGTYYVSVDGYRGDSADFDISFTCYGDCAAEVCHPDLRFGSPPGNLYLDGEWDRSLGESIFLSYYPGSGTEQTILSGDPESCDLQPAITWTADGDVPSRMLALDPRNGGQFWCGTISDYEIGSGCLFLVNASGAIVHSWTAIANLPILRWAGAAYDPDNDHLWVLIRDSSDAGQSRIYELDVSNAASPLVIQGPHPLPQMSPHLSVSPGGADYSEGVDHLIVAHQGYPADFIECYLDTDPAYAGPPPGPGLTGEAWCTPDSNRIQGFAVIAYDDGGEEGELLMTNFTDEEFEHPVNRYSAPCPLREPACPPVDNLVIRRNQSVITLNWTPSQPGLFRIFSSIVPNNDGDPDEGADPDFVLEDLVLAGGAASWTDYNPSAFYKIYVITATCF